MNHHALPAFVIASIMTGVAAAQPTVTELNRDTYARSQRIAITGTGFGTTGQVTVAGLEAWTSTWTPTRIVAYVPEVAAVGATTLTVTTGGETSDAVPLTVTLRQPNGRIRWTFETEGDDQWWRPAVAPDGTVYMHTNSETDGVVYAIAPNGALKWVKTINWYPYVPPSAGPDGAVYVGSIDTVYRLSPEGAVDWTLNGQEIGGTPTVGPDGMLYGAYEVQPGAFRVDPATGQYDWTNDPSLSNWGQPGNEIKFGRSGPGQPIDRFYVSWDAIWAFSLDGDHLFTTSAPNVVAHEPAIGSDGTIYMPGYNSAWLLALSADDGSVLWDTNSDWLAHISSIEIGPDDTLYFISDGRKMHAYDPHTQTTLWTHAHPDWYQRPTLSPSGEQVLATGGGNNEVIGFVTSFDTQTGVERWHVEFQETYNPNFRINPIHHPRFAPDGATAYVPTWLAQWPFHDGDPRAVLFAIDTTETGTTTGDLDGDGIVGFADLLLLLSAWGPCEGCPADLNGDGAVTFADLLTVLAAWTS